MNEQDSEACCPPIHPFLLLYLSSPLQILTQTRKAFISPSIYMHPPLFSPPLPPSNPHPHKTVFSLPPSLPPSLPHPHKTVFSPLPPFLTLTRPSSPPFLPPSLPPSPEQDRLFAVLTDAVHEIVERSVQLCHLLQPQQSVITQVGQYSRLHLTQAVLTSNQC